VLRERFKEIKMVCGECVLAIFIMLIPIVILVVVVDAKRSKDLKRKKRSG